MNSKLIFLFPLVNFIFITRGINIIDAKGAVSINIFDIVPGNC